MASDSKPRPETRKRTSFRCVHCGVTFPTMSVKTSHLCPKDKPEKNSVSIKCHLCHLIYSSKSNLKRHVMLKHQKSSEDLLNCQYCSKAFVTEQMLQLHLKSHKNKPGQMIKTFKCNMCNKSYKSRNGLRYHMKKCWQNGTARMSKGTCKNSSVLHKKQSTKKNFAPNGKTNFHKCQFCAQLMKDGLHSHSKCHEYHNKCKSKGTAVFKCMFCHFKSSTSIGFHLHMRRHGYQKTASSHPFKCEVCKKRYFNKHALHKHMRKFHKNKISKKSKCEGKTILTQPELSSNRDNLKNLKDDARVGPKSSIFRCNKSSKNVTVLNDQKTNKLVVYEKFEDKGNTLYKCKFCQFESSMENGFHSHMRRHDDQKTALSHPFKCEICKKLYLSKESLQRHVRKVHKNKVSKDGKNKQISNKKVGDAKCYTCSVCFKVFLTKGQLILHIKTHPDKKVPKNRSFTHTVEFGSHFSTQVPEQQNSNTNIKSRLKCFLCQKTFNRPINLRKHEIKCCSLNKLQNNRSNKAPNECKMAQKLKQADFKEGRGPKNLPFKCSLCFKSYSKPLYLRNHLRLGHKQEIPNIYHVCPVCDKTFRKKGTLDVHLRVHTKEKPFSCPCGKDFSQFCNLQVHMMKHTDRQSLFYLKDFHQAMVPLSQSDYAAKSDLYLRLTEKIEQGHKKNKDTYSCPVNSKEFCEMQALFIHMRNHNQRPHKCDDCGFAFKRISHLEKHLKSSTACSRRRSKVEDNRCVAVVAPSVFSSETLGADHADQTSTGAFHDASLHKVKNSSEEVDSRVSIYYETYAKDKGNKTATRGSTYTTRGSRSASTRDCDEFSAEKENLMIKVEPQAHLYSSIKEKELLTQPKVRRVNSSKYFEMAKKLLRKSVATLNRPKIECVVCDVIYHSQTDLDIHLRKHTSETPYECTLCGKAFTCVGNKSAHLRVAHKYSKHKKG